MADPRVRAAEPADVPAIVALVHELADYEKLPEHCHLTAGALHTALFGAAPAAFAHVAVPAAGSPGAGEVAGFALHFLNFSTWEGVHGIYLEDLYVRPELRGSGLGRALLANLAKIAQARGYARVEWSVLDWNAPSIAFYESLGAVGMHGWTGYRLAGAALAQLAGPGVPVSDQRTAAGTG